MTMSNKLKRRLRQQELLKNFEGDFYQEKKIGENWLVKSWNGTVGRWQVGDYSEDSFRRYKEVPPTVGDMGKTFRDNEPYRRATALITYNSVN